MPHDPRTVLTNITLKGKSNAMHLKTSGISILLLTLLALVGCAQTNTITQPVSVTHQGQPYVSIWPNSNSHSNNEATLSLLVKAGSLQERDTELGYAHFVEHMAFNGTDAFPGDAIREQLEYLGMSLGDHVNAYTTFDHTRYDLYLNSVDPERLEAAIRLLSEWAYRVEFSEQEVQKEKAIVVEEWRLMQTEADRVESRIKENYYAGTRGADRMPIGTRISIESATAEGLKAFYQRWYRANNMAIIVAGDVDAPAVAELVAQYFPEDNQNSPEPGSYKLNPAAMEERLILTDPYVTSGYVEINHYVDYPLIDTIDELVDINHWIAALDIWYDRVQARLPDTQGAVSNADYSWNHLSGDRLNIGLSANLAGDDFEQAIGLIEQERQRIIATGIDQAELDNWRNSLLEHERSQQDSAAYLADVIVQNILFDWPMLGQPERIKLFEQRLGELTPESVQAAFAALFNSDPKITLIHPYRSPAPTIEDINTWLDSAAVLPLATVASESETDTAWAINPATGGAIVKEEALAQDVTRWTLNNGMTVHYRHSDQAPGKVYYELVGLHGFNALSPSETIVARLALPTLGTSGLRDMNGSQLSEWLNARNITQMPRFSFFERGMYGSGPRQQFPVMMRLLHSALTEAQVDDTAWRHIRNQNREHLNQIQGHPHEPWIKTVEETLFRNDVAFRSLSAEELNRIDADSIQAIYDTYFSGTQNYQLSIVGDISRKTVRTSIIEAIATLPQQSADWSVGRAYPAPAETASHRVSGSGEQTATTVLRYSLPKTDFTETSFTTFNLLEAWLNKTLFEEIRENRGYVYSIRSTIDGATITQDEITLIIELSTDPENVETVLTEVKTQLVSLAESQATANQINQWHQTLKLDFQQNINGAKQQAEVMAYAPLFGQNPVEALTFATEPPATSMQLTALAAQFTDPNTKLVELIWMP